MVISRAHRRRRILVLVGVCALAAVSAIAVAAGGHPRPRHPRLVAPPAVIAWPATGSSAAYVPGVGTLDGPSAERPVPIASIAKVMTAYLILRDHPLAPGQPGPAITVSAAEASAYPDERSAGDSLVHVVAGEQITERQALLALLLPSADNMAWILARWDAGTVAAFARRMNVAAAAPAMSRTRYTDPSGLDAATVSTAADQVRLGRVAMRMPAFAAIVSQRTATIPVRGTIVNLDTLLGVDGILGIKTGSTSHAGGCVLLAAARGRGVTIAAVLGQPGSPAQLLPRALTAGRALIVDLDEAAAERGR